MLTSRLSRRTWRCTWSPWARGWGACCGLGLAYCACRVGTGVSPLLGWPRGIWELGVAVFGGSAAILILSGLTLPSWRPSLGIAQRRLGRHLAYHHLHPLWTAITTAALEVVLDP